MIFLAIFSANKSLKSTFLTAYPKELTYTAMLDLINKDSACSVFLVTSPPSPPPPTIRDALRFFFIFKKNNLNKLKSYK